MHAVQVLFDKAMDFCADDESKATNTTIYLDDEEPDILQFIQNTYGCNNICRRDRLRLTNLFNLRLFQDLYMVMENKIRNVIRVIIRNLMFIIRRYIITMCKITKSQRHETWLLNTTVMRPHIREYAITAVAKKLGPSLFRFPKFTCQQRDLAVRAMVNIFCSNTDRMWMPGQSPATVRIDTGRAKCHSDCICHSD